MKQIVRDSSNSCALQRCLLKGLISPKIRSFSHLQALLNHGILCWNLSEQHQDVSHCNVVRECLITRIIFSLEDNASAFLVT